MSTDWLSKTFERPDESPPEPEPVAKEEIGAPSLIQGERDIPKRGTSSSIGVPPKTGPGKADMRLKGEFSPELPADIQAERGALSAKELNFAEAQSFTRLNAGRALAQTKAQAQEIAASDFAEMDKLNKEHYQRWEEENTQFRADIDAARQLRVNPNNYMQSIGRSGRVSSVLAAAASQLAAGAGNPNMAWNRIKSTIDQDISAQKANIELEFAGIEVAKGQQTHEAAMLEKYYGFEEKSRAVAFTALEAQVGVIMQRATNEMEYQAYQMIRDRARAEGIDAAAAAMAKNATLYLDAPTHRAYQALINAKRWKEAQAMLQQAYSQELGGAQEVDTAIESYDQYGQPVTFDTPETALPVEAPSSPVEAGPAPSAARVARDKRPREVEAELAEPTVTPEPTAEAKAIATERPLTPEEADMERRLGGAIGAPEGVALAPEDQAAIAAQREAEKRAAADEKVLRSQAGAAQVEQGIVQRMTAKTIRKGGYAFVEAEQHGRRLQNRNTFLEARDIILDPTNPEIAVYASYEDAAEGLKYDTRTGAKAAYERKHPELYEGYNTDTFRDKSGKVVGQEANYINTNWGYLKFTRESTSRYDEKRRNTLREEVNGDFSRAKEIYSQAQAVQRSGAGSFFGFQITDDGVSWPGDEQSMKDLMEKQSGQIGLAIRAMKMLDPSGRLTDKDIIVGMEYMTSVLQNPGVKTFELASSIYRKVTGQEPSKGDIRRSINKTLRAMATKLSDALVEKHTGEFVLSYEQDQQFRDKSGEVEKWLRSEDKD